MTVQMRSQPGDVPIKQIADWFEMAATETATLGRRCKLSTRKDSGEFIWYEDAETNSFFSGFAIGIKMAQRLENQGGMLAMYS